KGIQQEGVGVFAPLRDKAAELSQELSAAGKVAAKQVREIGNEDLKVSIFRGLVSGIWYILLTGFIMYWIYGIKDIHKELDYLHNRVDVIQYNQTIDGAKFTPWDMKEFYEAWDKKNEQIWKDRNKKAQ
ncbi:MAG TPA: hypothetical protein HA255_03070, partial [Methanosphaera sp.]|nr:hypothetical protein [Methanosphaera sp.]